MQCAEMRAKKPHIYLLIFRFQVGEIHICSTLFHNKRYRGRHMNNVSWGLPGKNTDTDHIYNTKLYPRFQFIPIGGYSNFQRHLRFSPTGTKYKMNRIPVTFCPIISVSWNRSFHFFFFFFFTVCKIYPLISLCHKLDDNNVNEHQHE